ncbi:MAG: antitoxin [Thermoanaerobaculia bacterium]
MRTTLDIADDVLLAVKERARREKRSAGEILSECAREGLTHKHLYGINEPESFYGFEPLPPRGQAVSNELIDRLREMAPGAGPEHLLVL